MRGCGVYVLSRKGFDDGAVLLGKVTRQQTELEATSVSPDRSQSLRTSARVLHQSVTLFE
jgi:hypothetical protein